MNGLPGRVLMTVDAVGGVWRYAMDLAAALSTGGTKVVFAGLGPEPSAEQVAQAARHGRLLWLRQPLDWLAHDEAELAGIAPALDGIVASEAIDLLHLNLPSQAVGLRTRRPVVAVSHSCVATWFRAVRNADCPTGWAWQKRLNAEGFARADAVIAPSRSHAALLEACYGPVPHLRVVLNGSGAPAEETPAKQPFVFAAGRWWDEGKNGAVLDAAARHVAWPVRMAGATRGPNGQALSLVHAQSLGTLSADAVAERMRQAAVFSSPSVFEPFGLAALEAARAGAALVLADIPTYRELWEGAALFAAPREPEAFAEVLTQLARDDARRAELGAAARRRAGRFSLSAQAEATGLVYASLQPRSTRRAAG